MIRNGDLLSRPIGALFALMSDRSFLRWTTLSLFSFFLVLGTTTLLREVVGASEQLSFGAALCLATAVNFFTCKYLVFDSDQRYQVRSQMVMYVLTTLSFRCIEYIVYWLLLDLLSIHYLLAAVGVMGASFLGKFFVSKRIVFRAGT